MNSMRVHVYQTMVNFEALISSCRWQETQTCSSWQRLGVWGWRKQCSTPRGALRLWIRHRGSSQEGSLSVPCTLWRRRGRRGQGGRRGGGGRSGWRRGPTRGCSGAARSLRLRLWRRNRQQQEEVSVALLHFQLWGCCFLHSKLRNIKAFVFCVRK